MEFRKLPSIRNSKEARCWLEYCWSLSPINFYPRDEREANRMNWLNHLSLGITLGVCLVTFYLTGAAVLAVAEDMVQSNQPNHLSMPSAWRF